MDLILLFLGICFLILRRDAAVLAVIVFLASTYFQIALLSKETFLFPHNVSDSGLFLYICFFCKIWRNHKLKIDGGLQKCVIALLAFIVINGIYDIALGTSVADVVKYVRSYSYLTLVFIYPYIRKETSLNSLKIAYYMAMFICILQLFQRFTGLELIELRVDEGRGTKPISYSIFCSAIVLINLWNHNVIKRCLHLAIFLLPILLSLKMTYAISVILIYVIYLFSSPIMTFRTKCVVAGAVFFVAMAFLSISKDFTERLIGMTQETSSISQGESEGNFSFRILHAAERLNYILGNANTTIRGMGYVSEQNYNKNTFTIGTWNREENRIDQLITGDIAWSVFFVRLGLGGLFIYLFFYVTLICTYYRRIHLKQTIKDRKLAIYTYSMLVTFLVFTSLGNSLIAGSDFFIYPFLFLQDN